MTHEEIRSCASTISCVCFFRKLLYYECCLNDSRKKKVEINLRVQINYYYYYYLSLAGSGTVILTPSSPLPPTHTHTHIRARTRRRTWWGRTHVHEGSHALRRPPRDLRRVARAHSIAGTTRRAARSPSRPPTGCGGEGGVTEVSGLWQ